MATIASIWRRTVAVRQRVSDTCDAVSSKVPANPPDVIVAGDFRIDLNSRSASVRGHELHLSRPEFDVLVFLTSHRKRVITPHTRLATKSEEDGGVCQTEFLPALVSLRRKLQEEVPRVPYIRVEFWMLYDFDPAT